MEGFSCPNRKRGNHKGVRVSVYFIGSHLGVVLLAVLVRFRLVGTELAKTGRG